MWDWFKNFFLPRGGVGGIRLFSRIGGFCCRMIKGVDKNGGIGK